MSIAVVLFPTGSRRDPPGITLGSIDSAQPNNDSEFHTTGFEHALTHVFVSFTNVNVFERLVPSKKTFYRIKIALVIFNTCCHS